MARLAVLNQCAAPRAALPALRLREGVGAPHIAIFGAIGAFVRRAAADGACFVAARACRDAAGGVCGVGVEPDVAGGVVAVDALADGGGPLAGAGLEGGAEVRLDASVNCTEWDLVEAALWRPLLLVLEGVGNEAAEAVAAVAVAGGFDHGFREKLVEARYAFPVEVLA